MSDVLKKVKPVIEEFISQGDKVLVAVSGGADSLALLYILNHFSKDMGYELSVAHLNHMARGAESDGDAEFVEKQAKKLSLPLFSEKTNIAEEKPHLKTSFQEAARILRYQFLERILTSINGNKIAVGHTADDQVETVLINFLRGTGLKGLSGMPQKRGCVIRPLLNCYRAELEHFLKEKKLVYRNDSSNKDDKYLRNKIRHNVIPLLRSINNDISANILGLADIAKEEDQWFAKGTHKLYSEITTTDVGQRIITFEMASFQIQPLAMRRRLVREAFYRLSGNLRSISALHIRQVIELCSRARVGSWLMFPGNVRVQCDYDTFRFFIPENLDQGEYNLSELDKRPIYLKVPGITSLTEVGIRFNVMLVESTAGFHPKIDSKLACLDFDKTGEVIQVRYFQPGDTFVPLGMRGHKKLKSYFIDQKVPQEKRPSIPILTNADGDIIWVYRERISELFRITDKTNKVLIIEGIES